VTPRAGTRCRVRDYASGMTPAVRRSTSLPVPLSFDPPEPLNPLPDVCGTLSHNAFSGPGSTLTPRRVEHLPFPHASGSLGACRIRAPCHSFRHFFVTNLSSGARRSDRAGAARPYDHDLHPRAASRCHRRPQSPRSPMSRITRRMGRTEESRYVAEAVRFPQSS
jgi:hypothetical protein